MAITYTTEICLGSEDWCAVEVALDVYLDQFVRVEPLGWVKHDGTIEPFATTGIAKAVAEVVANDMQLQDECEQALAEREPDVRKYLEAA